MSRQRTIVAWAVGIPVAVGVVMSIVTTLVPSPRGEVATGDQAEGRATVFTLQLLTEPNGKLVAELPGAREVRVRAADKLWVKYLPDARGGRVFAVNAKGVPTSLPMSGGVALAPGSYDLFALHDLSMTEAQALEDAKAPWPPGILPVRASERSQSLQARLVVEP